MSDVFESPVDDFMLVRFKADALAAQGLPTVNYPLPMAALNDLLESGGGLEAPQLLVWMMQYVSDSNAPWRDYREVMLALLAICAPPDPSDTCCVWHYDKPPCCCSCAWALPRL